MNGPLYTYIISTLVNCLRENFMNVCSSTHKCEKSPLENNPLALWYTYIIIWVY